MKPETPGLEPSHDTAEEPSGALEPGHRLGPFLIRQRIGQGGMGVVYRAEDERLRREVALKVLPHDTSPGSDRERRLLREARAASSVTHPNIATIFEVGQVEGRLFVAMELVDGKSLCERIKAGPMPLADAVAIGLQVLDGLSSAHAVGVIHRDLKPANVMLTPRGVAKVLDFGVAARLWPTVGAFTTESTLTAEGKILGTPAYMAPEQARGLAADQRVDIFAFGVLLFEMLTGRRPFGGESVADVMSSLLRDPPIALASLRPDAPPSLSAVVDRCLAKEPAMRYGTCAEVRADLERVLSEPRQPPVIEGPAPAVVRTDNEPAPPSTEKVVTPTPSRAHRWLLAAALAGVVVALVLLLQPGREQPSTPGAQPAQAATGTAITDRPPPRSSKPEALTAYAAALQAFRDANWSRAKAHLERAVALDPDFAAAHLRLAIAQGALTPGRDARTSYANAVEGRATLDSHDRAMLAGLEPLVGVAQPDTRAADERWREATAAFPDDAEITLLASLYSLDQYRSVELARRATVLDPQYADAWQMQARMLLGLGRVAEAQEPLNRCTAISPMADDCRMERAYVAGIQGECTLMEEHLRVMVARGSETYPYVLGERASALFAMGRPDATIREALAQLWDKRDSADRPALDLVDDALLDVARGRFLAAEKKLLESGEHLGASPRAFARVEHAFVLALLYREMGRPEDTARVAEDYFARRDAWLGAGAPDKEMVLLRELLHTGRLSPEAFAAQRKEVLARAASNVLPKELWNLEHVAGLATDEEARAARAALSSLSADDEASLEMTQPSSLFMGRLRLLSGELDRAVTTLRRATSGCWELRLSLLYNPARLDLGRSLERTGDRPGACAAYGQILTRWGQAEPRSLTAEEALARSRALGCP